MRCRCLCWWIESWCRAENRARIVDAAEIGYREAGEILFENVPREGDEVERERLRFSAAFECKNCHRVYREPEPRLFSLQQSVWRVSALPGVWQHDRLRSRPDHSGQIEDARPRAPIDPWNRPKYRSCFTELKKAAKQHGIPMDVPWCDLSPDQQALCARRQRGISRRAWILSAAGTEEVQAARARDAVEVSRVCAVSGVQGSAAACRGAGGAHRRARTSARQRR